MLFDDLEFEDLADMLDDWKIRRKIIEPKGRVCKYIKQITLNPVFNEDIETLVHELVHIYEGFNSDVPEEIIEDVAQRYLRENQGAYHFLDCYLQDRFEYNDIIDKDRKNFYKYNMRNYR